MNSDEIIESLKPYGRVRIHQFDSGWSATFELFTPGVESTIRSDYKHPTMRSALIDLQAKLSAVLAHWKSLASKTAIEAKP